MNNLTESYINNFNRDNAPWYSRLGIPPILKLLHDHPAPFRISPAHIFYKYLANPRHDMRDHVYEEKSCDGGRLTYRGDVPILELDGQNPLQAGAAHGYLLGPTIDQLNKNLDLLIHSVLREPRSDRLPHVLASLPAVIPENIRLEMEGLSQGYNRWAEENNISRRMSLEDVMLMHLIPDSKHFHPGILENLPEERAAACTTILYQDQREGLIFGRNMDWLPFGDGGAKSLVIVWKAQKVAAMAIPGLIGAVTGWNQRDLCVAMNVCPGETTSLRGVPSILFNRMVLENCGSIQDVEDFSSRVRPLGPFHLTAADQAGNSTILSFYQAQDESDTIRRCQRAANSSLFAVNWKYPECRGGYFRSRQRTQLFNSYFEGAAKEIPPERTDGRMLVENALRTVPLVNSWLTMHSLVFSPQKDIVDLSWDNGYAASQPRQRLSMGEVFN